MCHYYVDPVRKMSFCQTPAPRPIDFVYDYTSDWFDLSNYKTDEDLLAHIKLGQSSQIIDNAQVDYLKVKEIFGDTTPENVYQNKRSGENTIDSASAAIYHLKNWMRLKDGRGEWLVNYIKMLKEFNAEAEHVQFASYLYQDYWSTLQEQTVDDRNLGIISVSLIVIYLILFLGACSPIHCKRSVALVGIVCIALSVLTGASLAIGLGHRETDVHSTMPVLMLGIGVDDMFVICNALDQSSLRQPLKDRFVKAIQHAGSTITITSFTNVFAFMAGSYSSIPVIQSFCMHCALTILCLYLSVMSIFLCFVYWDAYRISKKCGECCGLFFCKENSILCFKGKLLSDAQKEYSGILLNIVEVKKEETDETKERNSGNEGDDTSIVASRTEQFLLTKFAPFLLKPKVKATILVIYALFTIFCLVGVFKMRTYFSLDLLINDEHISYDYINTRDKYFKPGFSPTVYVVGN